MYSLRKRLRNKAHARRFRFLSSEALRIKTPFQPEAIDQRDDRQRCLACIDGLAALPGDLLEDLPIGIAILVEQFAIVFA